MRQWHYDCLAHSLQISQNFEISVLYFYLILMKLALISFLSVTLSFQINLKMAWILSWLICHIISLSYYTLPCGGAVVYWFVHLTLIMGARVQIPPLPDTLVLQQDNFYPHCCSSRPRCINGDLVRCEGYVECVFACSAMIGSSARIAPLGVELVHCKCGL